MMAMAIVSGVDPAREKPLWRSAAMVLKLDGQGGAEWLDSQHCVHHAENNYRPPQPEMEV